MKRGFLILPLAFLLFATSSIFGSPNQFSKQISEAGQAVQIAKMDYEHMQLSGKQLAEALSSQVRFETRIITAALTRTSKDMIDYTTSRQSAQFAIDSLWRRIHECGRGTVWFIRPSGSEGACDASNISMENAKDQAYKFSLELKEYEITDPEPNMTKAADIIKKSMSPSTVESTPKTLGG